VLAAILNNKNNNNNNNENDDDDDDITQAATRAVVEQARLLSRLVLADQAHRLEATPPPQPGKAMCLRFDGRHAERGAFLSDLFSLIGM
jgi:hypothetical protein